MVAVAISAAQSPGRIHIWRLSSKTWSPIQDARKLLVIPKELQNRVKFQIQDFFQPQPETLTRMPPTIYLLSRVLHDWHDADCIRILQHLLPATEKGTKLFIVDRILPDHSGDIFLYQEALIRSMDLFIYTMTRGKERTLKEWDALFKCADSRLNIDRIEIPVGSDLGMIELSMQ